MAEYVGHHAVDLHVVYVWRNRTNLTGDCRHAIFESALSNQKHIFGRVSPRFLREAAALLDEVGVWAISLEANVIQAFNVN